MFGQRILAFVIPAWVAKPAVGEPWFGNAFETKRRLRAMRGVIGRNVQSTTVSDNRLKDEFLDESRINHLQRLHDRTDNKKRLRHMRIVHPSSSEPVTEPDNCLKDQLLDVHRTIHSHEIDHLAVEYWRQGVDAESGQAQAEDDDFQVVPFLRKLAFEKAAKLYVDRFRSHDQAPEREAELRTTDVAWLIADDTDKKARLKLARNLSCPLGVLEKLMRDRDNRVAFTAIKTMRRLLSGDQSSAIGLVRDWSQKPINDQQLLDAL